LLRGLQGLFGKALFGNVDDDGHGADEVTIGQRRGGDQHLAPLAVAAKHGGLV
jgi:hypothetical protein